MKTRLLGLSMAFVWVLLALVGCSESVEVLPPSSTAAAAAPGQLTPYLTRTATLTPLPPDPATATPFPTPTATPRTHVVKAGEDMYGIAFRYGVSIDELRAANPEVNPNLMSVGAVLVIPAGAQEPEVSGTLPTPTPVAVQLGEPVCYPGADGGAWCFIAANNLGEAVLESVSARVRLADADGVQVAELTALNLLNMLPAGASLPLLVHLPSPLPEGFQVNADLQTAFLSLSADTRYLPAAIEQVTIEYSADRKSARVEGIVRSLSTDRQAENVWVVAVAYSQHSQVVGARRWEADALPGTSATIPFSLFVYSMAVEIEQIEWFVEAW